jgi:hypothetical protein
LHHDNANTSFFTREFLTKSSLTAVTTHPTFLFLPLNIKLKSRNSDTIKVMEAQSQALLNTLSEHYFQDAFKKWQKHS